MPPRTSAASTRQPSGQRRYYTAQQAGAAIAGVVAAAELALLAAVASFVLQVLAGSLLAALAYRRFRRVVLAIITQAELDLRPVLAAVSASARADVEAVIAADLGPLARLLPVVPSASAPRLSASLRNALNRAAAEADAQFRRITAAASLQEAQRLLDELAATGLTGFTGRTGRDWNLTAYAEMAARTAAEQLHLALQMHALQAAGIDLVYVQRDSSLPPCPKCAPFVHRVLSVSGMSGGIVSIAGGQSVAVAGTLAQAKAAGLFHPSCRDSAQPVTGMFTLPADGPHSQAWLEAQQRRYQNEQDANARWRAYRQAQRLHAVAISTLARARARRLMRKLG